MTTLVVTSSWPRTGDELAGTFVRTDAIERASRANVVVAAPDGPGTARTGVGLTVIDVPHGGLFGSPGAAERVRLAPLRALGLMPFGRSLRALVRDVRPTKIVAHWIVPCGLVVEAILPRGRSIELELVAHGADVRLLQALPRPLARRLVEGIARRASIVRAVSASLAARLIDIAPMLESRMVVSPMPLVTDDVTARARLREAGERLGVGARPLHVVASRLVASKRIERAIDHVASHGGRLVVVGDGPERAALIDRARRLHVDARFLGARPHDEALAWIAAADVLLAPLARDEGAPTVVREATSLAVAVVPFAS
jgi:teichuronic acid biosynthesis glycosyltransferase TuaC